MNTKQSETWKQLVQQCRTQCKKQLYSSINVASLVRSDAIVAAGTLVELVTLEVAALLEQMADYAREAAHVAKGSPDDVDAAYIAEETARELAAQIKGALDEC